MAIDVDVCIDCRAEPPRQVLRRGGLRSGRGNDREFVAADAREEGAITGLLQALCQLFQNSVAGVRAKRVVDRFEPVDVDDQKAKAVAGRGGQIHDCLEALVEGRAVWKLGQRIVVRHIGDAGLVALALGQVVQNDDQILRLAVRDPSPAGASTS